MKIFIIIFITIINFGDIYSQNSEVNTDTIYYKAKALHLNKEYKVALNKVNEGILIAPEYVDIRILRIKICQEINKFNQAAEDLYLLLNNETNNSYKSLVFKQITTAETTQELKEFINKTALFYNNDIDYILYEAEAYLRIHNPTIAKTVIKRIENRNLNQGQKYRYRLILKQINKNQIGVYHETLSFMDEYSQQKSWNTSRLEYIRFIGLHSLTGRVSYSKRFSDNAVLYELESYPVFSKKSYGFINLSTSKKTDFFQNLGIKASVFYAVTKWIEIEGGVRYLKYQQSDFTSYVFGLTSYQNKFYLNTRAFVGPKLENTFIQNYQLNVRYYYSSNDDYAFVRVGTGISPDESTRFTQITENPNLSSYYFTIGLSKQIGYQYNLIGSVGYLNEDLQNNKTGNQISGSIGLRYRF